MAPAATAVSAFRALTLFAPRQVDNLGVDRSRHGFQFCLADAGLENLQVRALYGDDGKAGPAGATPCVAALANKDLAHRAFLSGTLWRAVVIWVCFGHLPKTSIHRLERAVKR
jgi:hypothetical protein